MIIPSTRHEERASDSFIVRGVVYDGDVEIASADLAYYVKIEDAWFFGVIDRQHNVVSCDVPMPSKARAQRLAERAATLLLAARMRDVGLA
jgi:hypothetical protein